MIPGDRTVHGLAADGSEVARYDKAGAWYLEPVVAGRKRRRLRLIDAVTIVRRGTHYPGLPGGLMLDAWVRRDQGLP